MPDNASSTNRGTRRLVTSPRTKYIDSVIRPRKTPVKKSSSVPGVTTVTPILVTQKTAYSAPVKAKRKKSKLGLATILVGASMLVAGSYITITGWRNDQVAKVQAAKLTTQVDNNSGKAY